MPSHWMNQLIVPSSKIADTWCVFAQFCCKKQCNLAIKMPQICMQLGIAFSRNMRKLYDKTHQFYNTKQIKKKDCIISIQSFCI